MCFYACVPFYKWLVVLISNLLFISYARAGRGKRRNFTHLSVLSSDLCVWYCVFCIFLFPCISKSLPTAPSYSSLSFRRIVHVKFEIKEIPAKSFATVECKKGFYNAFRFVLSLQAGFPGESPVVDTRIIIAAQICKTEIECRFSNLFFP